MAPDPQPWDVLIERLTASGLKKGDVSEMVSLVSKALDTGDGKVPPWLRGFPKGTPNPDSIVIHLVLQRDQLRNLANLLVDTTRIDAVRVFPRGIIDPGVFLTEIEMR